MTSKQFPLWALLCLLSGLSGCSHQNGGESLRPRSGRFVAHPALGQAAEGTLADVAEQSLPAVVNISSTRLIRQGGGSSPFFSDPFFRQFFGDDFFPFREIPRERREKSLGSGVIVSSDGIVVTNNHVVQNADEIRVALADRRELSAKLIGADPKSDVAVLRLQGNLQHLQSLSFGDSNRLRLGDVVLAIGNPFGVGQTVTMGIVSAKGRADMGIVDYEDFIQTDAAINPGNSGGALVNLAGELVGINTAILSRSGGYQGIGFAIPSNMVRPIMENLLKHGKVVRGWLGAAVQEITPQLALAFGLDSTSGVLISDVTAGSPAAQAGLQRGDVLLAINGETVSSPGRFRSLLAASGAGTRVRVELWRKGQRISTTIELSEVPSGSGGMARLAERDGVLGGLVVASLSPALREQYNLPEALTQGVVVEQVTSNSPAGAAGLRPGDVLLELNREPLKSVEQFARRYRAARGQLLLLLYREGNTLYLLLSK